MDSKILIDRIGPSVIAIADDRSEHCVTIAPGPIKIRESGVTKGYDADQFPISYDTLNLGGRLEIYDCHDRMVYYWRSKTIPLQNSRKRQRSRSQRRRDSLITNIKKEDEGPERAGRVGRAPKKENQGDAKPPSNPQSKHSSECEASSANAEISAYH